MAHVFSDTSNKLGNNSVSKPFALTARKLRWDFSQSDAKYWLGGNAFMTAAMNVYTMLVPDNEKYYIRSMTPLVDQLDDVEQRYEVMEFFRQESLHGIAHKKHWNYLAKAGINVNQFVAFTCFLLYRVLEPLQPKWLRLSIVAAVEHINASLAHYFLKRRLLERADPELRRLFEWHFAEEIEHKAVAHDFLAALSPGYVKRILGGLIAYVAFYSLLATGTLYLLASSGDLFRLKTLTDAYQFLLADSGLSDTFRHFIRYLNPNFRPWALDDRRLATSTILKYSTGSEPVLARVRARSPEKVAV